MRIVSLLPAATEIVAALGFAKSLVGVSHECDWPPEVNAKPRVTHCEIYGKGLPSAEVDRICRATGFLAVTNHGIPQAVIDAAWSKARAFVDLPPEQKQRAKAPYKGYPYG